MCCRAQHCDQAWLGSRSLGGGHLRMEFLFKAMRTEGLPAFPRAGIGDDLAMLIVDGDGGRVCFDGEFAAHIASRHAVPVAIEGETHIFMNQRLGQIAIIGDQRWQGAERFRLKPLVRLLAGFAMRALIGDFVDPLACLRIHIGQVGAGGHRPEVLANVSDSAFDLAFFPRRANVARSGNEIALARKGEEPRIEADQIILMFGNRSRQIVEPDFAARARQELKGMNVTAGEGLKALAVRKLQIHPAAVSLDEAEGVEFARGPVVDERAEMAPVHVEPFAGRGLDTNVSAAGDGTLPQYPQIVLNNGEPAVVSERFKALGNDGSVGVRVLQQKVGDGRLPRIYLAGTFTMQRLGGRRLEILRNRAAADAQMARDLSLRPLLYPMKAMQFADLVPRKHLPFVIRLCTALDQ